MVIDVKVEVKVVIVGGGHDVLIHRIILLLTLQRLQV